MSIFPFVYKLNAGWPINGYGRYLLGHNGPAFYIRGDCSTKAEAFVRVVVHRLYRWAWWITLQTQGIIQALPK